MGYYLNEDQSGNVLPRLGKAEVFLNNGDAEEIYIPKNYEEGLVCVVDNGKFDAALYIFSKNEFEYIINNPDPRPKIWLKFKDPDVPKKLSGYTK